MARPSYPAISPALVVGDGARALEFYREVFGAEERMSFATGEGKVAHAELEIGGSVLMVEDAIDARGTRVPPAGGFAGSPIYLFVVVEDVDATVARAVELDANLVRAPEDQPIGFRDAFLVDPFGHSWTVATPL